MVTIEGTTVTVDGKVSTYDLRSQAMRAYCHALIRAAEKKSKDYLNTLNK